MIDLQQVKKDRDAGMIISRATWDAVLELALKQQADAKRFAWLRSHTCNSLHLTRDGDHACNYVTAQEWIETHSPEDFMETDESEINAMKATNTIWRLQIYPNTPIGFYAWHGATLDSAVDAARSQLQEND